MTCSIASSERSFCISCGHNKFKWVSYQNREVQFCASCPGKEPANSYRVRRKLPVNITGKSERIDIRYDSNHIRLTDVFQALSVANEIDREVLSGEFDPSKYKSAKSSCDFHFENYWNRVFYPYQVKRESKGKISEKYLTNQNTQFNHLIKAFKGVDIRRITRVMLREFLDNFEGSDRTGSMALSQMSVLLGFAAEREVIKDIPKFPPVVHAKERDVKEFISAEDQLLILSYIENNQYRNAIEILMIYAWRPCDIRALKWSDLDFNNRKITISSHFSANKDSEGRKSTKEKFFAPMTERFIEIVQDIPRSINPDGYIFSGRQAGAIGLKTLNDNFKKARNIVNKKYRKKITCTLYTATKHSTLSRYLQDGIEAEKLILLSGHTTVKTLKRYAKLTDTHAMNEVLNILQ